MNPLWRMSTVLKQKSEIRNQKAEGRKQKAEGRRSKAGERGQKSRDRMGTRGGGKGVGRIRECFRVSFWRLFRFSRTPQVLISPISHFSPVPCFCLVASGFFLISDF
jgi:hypothetical protein